MNVPTPPDSVLVFASEPDGPPASQPAVAGWRLLIVDDEPSVHEVTQLALSSFDFDGRPLEFLHAYSAADARRMLESDRDIAVAIVDVVMESEHAGLGLVRWIRQDLRNGLIRLILRTGQPGHAPERSVIHDYEINDYREKADLTAQRLYTSILTSLRSYRDLRALEAGRRSLESIIRAIGQAHDTPGLTGFVQASLEQLIAQLRPDADAMFVLGNVPAATPPEEPLVVVAATGRLAPLVDSRSPEQWPPQAAAAVAYAMRREQAGASEAVYSGCIRGASGRQAILFIDVARPLTGEEVKLAQLFLGNVSVAYEKALPRAAA